ncbi:hypothetical protein [Rubripirellula tenax]|nr:hypothetical protein [Rubripirellula tenax]
MNSLRSFRIIAVFALCLVLVVASIAIHNDVNHNLIPDTEAKPATRPSTVQPSAMLTVSLRDLGVVSMGTVVPNVATVKNTGNCGLRLRACSGGCRAPEFAAFRNALPAGATESLALRIRHDVPGTHESRAELYTDDPANPYLGFAFTYTILPQNGG